MSILSDGTVVQSAMTSDTVGIGDQLIFYPIIGIISAVYFSDEKNNNSSVYWSSCQRDLPGSRIECDVHIIRDRRDQRQKIPLKRVPVMSPHTGMDDYEEIHPTPATNIQDFLDQKIPAAEVDGDWVVVQFLGGRIDHPIITGFYPHPGNRQDAAIKTDGRKKGWRHRGTKFKVDNLGNIELNTLEANFDFDRKNRLRKKKEVGGTVIVNVKENQVLKVVCGETTFEISGKEKIIRIQGNERIELSQQDTTPSQSFVLGEQFQNLLVDKILSYLATHQHIGNLGVPTFPDPASLSTLNSDVIPAAQSRDWLSDLIKGNK